MTLDDELKNRKYELISRLENECKLYESMKRPDFKVRRKFMQDTNRLIGTLLSRYHNVLHSTDKARIMKLKALLEKLKKC